MNLISKLFKKQRMPTRLEQAVTNISQQMPFELMRDHKHKETRLALGISTSVLYTVGEFIRVVVAALERNPKYRKQNVVPASIDAAIYETTAYFHYVIMRDKLLYKEDDDVDDLDEFGDHKDEDDESEADEHVDNYLDESIRSSINISCKVIKEFASFEVNEKHFAGKITWYAPALITGRTIRDEAEDFEKYLVTSIINGAPIKTKEPFQKDAYLEETIKLILPLFHGTKLVQLQNSIIDLHSATKACPTSGDSGLR